MVQAINQKHSEYGVASFSISIFWFLCVAIYAFIQSILPVSVAVWQVLTSFICFTTFVIPLLTLLLGIIGLFQKNRKKLFAVLGTIFSAVFLILYIGFTIYMWNVVDDPRVFYCPYLRLPG